MNTTEDADVDSVIEQLRKEKDYLFARQEIVAAVTKTAGVKEKMPGGRSVLERSARKAATSGNRADVQEYLRVRRQFI